jgi:galactose mutarotase-like enzyme
MIAIQNEQLTVQIKTKGAELCSIYNKQTALEYMWSGNAAYWGKTSPILFPIVGTLKGNTYMYNNQTYSLPRHGFAREYDFTVEEHTRERVVFLLQANNDTLKVFPFLFELRIMYSLHSNKLSVTYEVTNNGNNAMYFSIGAHPAFALPLVAGTVYDDYQLVFNNLENADKWPISAEGLIEATSIPFFNNSHILPLQKALFYKDALVLKHIASTKLTLQSPDTKHGFHFYMEGFPYLGLWAAKDADFICIEPWCGIADSVTHNQQLTEKEGIISLAANALWQSSWAVEVF